MTDTSTPEQKLEQLIRSKPEQDEFCEAAVRLIADSNDAFDWVGIYLAEDEILQLPETYYQGAEPDHKVIPFDEGICGASARSRETIVVDDVKSDPRYLACSIYTQSEIVVPIIKNGQLYGVLDLDSDTLAAFQSDEQSFLESAANLIADYFNNHT
ncbi:MAG: Free methionine-R-sulfoxide reductase [Candidatus Marinimicrobia bacterium]|nr:Free methionine-R-sulfoxide reductase [Candidatus Neomarinimicrobiota bacterium]